MKMWKEKEETNKKRLFNKSSTHITNNLKQKSYDKL